MKRDIDGLVVTEGISYHHMNAMFDCACITGFKNRLAEVIREADSSHAERLPAAFIAGRTY